jgi:hypothetical protein
VLPFIVWDVETTSLNLWSGDHWTHRGGVLPDKKTWGGRVFGCGVAIPDTRVSPAVYNIIWVRSTEIMLWDKLVRLLKTPVRKVAHNAKWDVQACVQSAIPIDYGSPLDCTLLGSFFVSDREIKHGLEYLGRMFTGHNPWQSAWDQPIKDWLRTERSAHTRAGYPKGYINYSHVPDSLMRLYNWEDVYHTLVLKLRFDPVIDASCRKLYDQDMHLIRVAVGMENRGHMISVPRASKLAATLGKKSKRLAKKLAKEVGTSDFNPRSWQQVLALSQCSMFSMNYGRLIRSALPTPRQFEIAVTRLTSCIAISMSDCQQMADSLRVSRISKTCPELNRPVNSRENHQSTQ